MTHHRQRSFEMSGIRLYL